MGELEDLKDKILELTDGKFNLYYTHIITMDAKFTAQWYTDDIEGFISIAQSIGVKLLYFYTLTIEDDDDPDHGSEIALIQLGYLYNSILHIFIKEADWFGGPVEVIKGDEYGLTNQSIDDLITEMVKSIEQEPQDFPDEDYRIESYLRDAQKSYWYGKGVYDTHDRAVAKKIDEVNARVSHYFIEQHKVEHQKKLKEFLDKPIEHLVDEMVQMTGYVLKDQMDSEEQLRSAMWAAKRQFWIAKGLEQTTEPQIELKKQKVDLIFKNHFTELYWENVKNKEAGLLPHLIEECVIWCRENNLQILTKTNTKVFLREKKIRLSTTGAETLYLKVNQKLRSY